MLPVAPPPAPVLTVDWEGSGDHLTISSALADPSIVPGAKIYIRGLSDSQGQPIAYSEHGPDLSNPIALIPMETFPLVVPEGVQLIRLPGSPPPWIWSDGSAGIPSAVIEISDSLTTSEITLLKGLRIVSASAGVEVSANGSVVQTSPSLDLKMRNVYFGGSTVGLDLTAGNGHLVKAELVDCSHVHFETSSLNLVNPPSLQSPEVGFRFYTSSNSGNTNGGGQIEVSIQNLQAQSAAYPTQPRQFSATTDFALADLTPSASRLIEFYAWGQDESLHQHSGDMIPSIDAELLGCDLNGRKDALVGWGWDIGVYATTRSSDGEPSGNPDYHSAISLKLAGCDIREYEIAGVYACANRDGRLRLDFEESRVDSCGLLGGIGNLSGNGIHTFSKEGYLALLDFASVSTGNASAGILAHSYGTRNLGLGQWPQGSLIRLNKTSIRENLGHGLRLAGPGTYLPEEFSKGIIGSTWDNHLSFGVSIRENPNKPLSLDYGLGSVDRIEVSNNAGDGINIWMRDSTVSTNDSVAALVIANSFIWQNNQSGVHFEADINDGATKLVCPITHCTIAENLESSFKVSGVSVTNSGTFFHPDTAKLDQYGDHKMRIFNSVFQMNSGASPDWSSTTQGHFESIGTSNLSPSRIAIGGLRATQHGGGQYPAPNNTNLLTPFRGLSEPNLAFPIWLDLAPGPSTGFTEDTIPSTYDISETLTLEDFHYALRPALLSGLRDKGPSEVN